MLKFTTLWLAMFCLFMNTAMGQTCSNRGEYVGFGQPLIDAIQAYTCGDVVDYHVDNMPVAHGVQFLQWHREYVEGLEDYLAANGFASFVPLPAWDPCTEIPKKSLITCSEQIPMDRDLEEKKIACGNFATDLYKNCENFCDYEDFEDFQDQLQDDHDGIHGAVDGTFDAADSPGVILFWPWHAYVDDIYLKYQAATLDPSLSLGFELIDKGCCEFTFRTKKYCCLNVEWSIDNKKRISSTSSDENYNYLTLTSTAPGFTVYAHFTSSCGETRDVGRSYFNDLQVPVLPSVPPIDFERICFDDEPRSNCYDFGNFECLESLLVTTSSPKLIAHVNGTEICLSYIHPAPFTGSITVTPVGTCGQGEPVTWTIYANQKEDCRSDGGWGPKMKNENVSIFPNPFSDQLIVDVRALETENSYVIELLDMRGGVLQKSTESNTTFNTANFAPGLYLVRIVNEENEVIFSDRFLRQ